MGLEKICGVYIVIWCLVLHVFKNVFIGPRLEIGVHGWNFFFSLLSIRAATGNPLHVFLLVLKTPRWQPPSWSGFRALNFKRSRFVYVVAI